MKAEDTPVPIVQPCPKSWEGMSGDDKRRFCGECRLHVHNLSAMTRGEREKFVTDARGRTCISYELKPDGAMVTASRWSRLPFYRAVLSAAAALAAVFPMLFSSCSSSRRMMGTPVAPPPTSGDNRRLLGEAPPNTGTAESDASGKGQSKESLKGRMAPDSMRLGGVMIP